MTALLGTPAPAPGGPAADVEAVVADLAAGRRRTSARAAAVVTVLLLLGAGGLGAQLVLGSSVRLPLGDTLAAAVGQGRGLARFVVFETRLPRALTAALAGALFGLSGVVYQRLTGNLLATPDIIGVSAGAGAGAVAVLVLGGGSGLGVQLGALAGAGLAVAVIFVLGAPRTGGTYRLVLVGIGVGACAAALTSYLLTLADQMTTERALRWLVGSINGAGWADVRVLLAAAALAGATVVVLGPDLEAVRLGHALATGLGTRVTVVRVVALLLGAGAAALATSVTGPIGFVGLVAGPVVARLVPQAGVLTAALLGAVLLTWSDVAARTGPLVSPVPTGLLTAVLGAPVLVHLLLRPRADA